MLSASAKTARTADSACASAKNPAILAINPGSTSTKLAMYHGLKEAKVFEIEWKLRSGLRGPAVVAEVEKYVAEIEKFLKSHHQKPDAVVGRGGFIHCAHRPLKSGVYWVAKLSNGHARVCEDIFRSVTESPDLDHASNYGIPVAAQIARDYNIPAFAVDPVVVDDMQDVARFSGYAPIQRRSLAHVLSVRAIGRKAAAKLGKDFFHTKMVAVHLGGGISVAALRDGRIVDVNNALLGGGPFSPQRVGSLPMRELIDLCYSGKFTKQELYTELTKRGGLVSYLGDDNCLNIENRIAAGDKQADLVMRAMAYQVAKEVGAMAVAAGGRVDAIVFSGGLSRSDWLMNHIRPQIEHLAPVIVYPGSLEMEAMAHGAYRVLAGQEEAMTYSLT
jgi:butyrate kinase